MGFRRSRVQIAAPRPILSQICAEVAEWQTRWSQKPLGASPCGFDSHLRHHVGAWLSLVERSVRDAEVGGSNPLAPTTKDTVFFGRPYCLLNHHSFPPKHPSSNVVIGLFVRGWLASHGASVQSLCRRANCCAMPSWTMRYPCTPTNGEYNVTHVTLLT
jgi:hypothetical protein